MCFGVGVEDGDAEAIRFGPRLLDLIKSGFLAARQD
jgi:hypothetical protein